MHQNDKEFFELTFVDSQVSFLNQYSNVLDLGISLIDFQAIISGFTKIFEDDIFPKIEVDESEIDHFDHEERERQERIKRLISNEVPQINPDRIDRLSKLIDLYYEPKGRVVADKKEIIRPYPTTSRKFSNRYKNLIQLKEFRQGSLILEIATTVAAGLVLKFIERLLFKEDKVFDVHINNNIVIINNDNTSNRIIRVEDTTFSDKKLVDKNHQKINEYYDSILDSIDIDSNDIEESVIKFLDKLVEEKLLSKNVVYNKRGIKTFTSDIERFRGNLYDMCI